MNLLSYRRAMWLKSTGMKPQIVSVSQKVHCGPSQPLLLIAGPCQIESLEHCSMVAEQLLQICSKFNFNLVFKSSFDKANRTSLSSLRGVGIDEGLKVLEEIRTRFKVPVLTDVHDAEQASVAGKVVDVLQIPAFLCRQTDLLVAAGETGKCVNVKKGQFLPPADMQFAAEKIASKGNKNILLCERGSCFGYRDLIVDMRGLIQMRQLGYPVVFDATHSVQSMGGSGGKSGGSREFVAPLARAAVAVGVDGVFIECHEHPERAPSDSASMLRLSDMPELLSTIQKIRSAVVEA